jgi:RNA polymerase sigma-70 factor (ECF subfamily)
MVEYFMWQQLEGMRQFGAVFGPLVEAATPYWWRYALERSVDPRGALHLIPRDPVWLRIELPVHVARGQRIANAILLDPFEADEAVANALKQTERVPYVPENFGAYFDQAVRHAAYDIQRRQRRHPRMASIDDIALHFDLYYDSPSPEEEAIGRETGQMIRYALAELSPVEQNALILHHVEGLSIPETARALGLTVYRTQNILVRARRKLRVILAPRLARGGPVRETHCGRSCRASA